MTDEERERAFRAERRRQARRMTQIQRDTIAVIAEILDEALQRIERALAEQPSDYQLWRLPRLRRAVTEAMDALALRGAEALHAGAEESVTAGAALLDAPVAAAGIEISGLMPQVDLDQLEGLRATLTGQIRGISRKTADRINLELGQVIAGTQTPADAAAAVRREVKTGGRARALVIVRTELGRAYADAHQRRQEQAAALLPGLRKQWRRSGKLHPRLAHALADGQIREVKKPFLVNGVELMYPRDPEAPARETVNCGCASLPYMARWEVRHPGEQPFTPAELAASPSKRRAQQVRDSAFTTFARRAMAPGPGRATGEIRTLRSVSNRMRLAAGQRQLTLATDEIAVSDKMLRHMGRPAKRRRGQALPAAVVERLPAYVDRPRAVLWDLKSDVPEILIVFDVPGESRLGTVAVRLGTTDARSVHPRHNLVVSGGLIDRQTLQDTKRYEPVEGAI